MLGILSLLLLLVQFLLVARAVLDPVGSLRVHERTIRPGEQEAHGAPCTIGDAPRTVQGWCTTHHTHAIVRQIPRETVRVGWHAGCERANGDPS